jgi:hypothetical protein
MQKPNDSILVYLSTQRATVNDNTTQLITWAEQLKSIAMMDQKITRAIWMDVTNTNWRVTFIVTKFINDTFKHVLNIRRISLYLRIGKNADILYG